MSNRLEHLRHVASTEFERHTKATAEATQAYLDCGAALLEAKESCGHGDWLPWLAASGVPERTAQRMMKLAATELKSDNVTDLGGVKAALDFVAMAPRIERADYLMKNAGENGEHILALGVTEAEFWDLAYLMQWQVLTWGEDRTLADLAAYFQMQTTRDKVTGKRRGETLLRLE